VSDLVVVPTPATMPMTMPTPMTISSENSIKLDVTRTFLATLNHEAGSPCVGNTVDPALLARSTSLSLQNSRSVKEMVSNVSRAHSLCSTVPGFSGQFSLLLVPSLSRILSTPPSSPSDHVLLTASLSLLSALLPHLSLETFALLVRSLSLTALTLLDTTVVTAALAARGVDANGVKPRPKGDKYGTVFTTEEERRHRRKANRALGSLWGARHQVSGEREGRGARGEWN